MFNFKIGMHSSSLVSPSQRLLGEARGYAALQKEEDAKKSYSEAVEKAKTELDKNPSNQNKKIFSEISTEYFTFLNGLKQFDLAGTWKQNTTSLQNSSFPTSRNDVAPHELQSARSTQESETPITALSNGIKPSVFEKQPSSSELVLVQPASMPIQRSQVALSLHEKHALADYLFGMALSTLGSLEVSNKPSLFLVYAHDNENYLEKAEADTSKYLIEKLSEIKVNLYSDQNPMGQPYSSSPEDLKKESTLEDILTSQLCLLPDQLRDDVKPVDKVVVCCSELLGKYLGWQHYKKFYEQLQEAYLEDREAYRKDGAQEGTSKIRDVVQKFSEEKEYKAGFHHVLTEMAFLQIRADWLKNEHGIIPVLFTPESYQECLSHFIRSTTVRMNDISRSGEQAKVGRQVYRNQGRHLVLFKLIERVLADSREAKPFLNKFWQGYSDFISHLKNEPATLGELEFVKLVEGIFGGIRTELHSQLATMVRQVYPAWRQVGTQLLDQSRDLAQIQTGVDSLVKKLLGNLQENIQKLRATYLDGLEKDREIKDALANYVSLEGALVGRPAERFDLESKVQEYLNSDKKILLLLGDAGSGKSTFNRRLVCSLWEAYTQASTLENTAIPVFIQLSSLPESNRNLVGTFFETQGFSQEQIRELQTQHRFILILDGFDEIKDRQRAFYKDNQLDDWTETKIIISSRPEYLGSNYQSKFHLSGERATLQEYQLLQFSAETIEQYVDQYKKAHPAGPWSAQQYKEALKQQDLKELVGNPFLLKITMSVLPELSKTLHAKGQRFTRIGLYDEFVKSWFDRSQQRLSQIQLNPEEIKEFRRLDQKGFAERGVGFSKKLATEMYRAGEVVTTYLAAVDEPWEEPRAELGQAWRKRLLGDDNAITILMRLNAPLICQNEQYRFIHKSIQDYFVARALWEQAEKGIEKGQLLNQLQLVKDAAILQFLSERVRQEAELKAALLSLVERSKEEAEFEVGAANAMTVLVRAEVQFNECDLKGIKIPGADLSFGVFDSAQLQGADLRETNFRASWLCRANLSGAQMTGVRFGEWPYLYEQSAVNSCAYSPDGKTCAMGLEKSAISVYSTLSWEKNQTLEGHTGEVRSVVYSPSGTQIASGSHDHTVRLWDAQSGAPGHTLEGHAHWVNSVVYSPSGAQIASGSRDKTVRLWDAQSGAPGHTLEGHTRAVNSVVYSPSGAQIASGSDDKTVRLWDAHSGTPGCTLHGHTTHVFSVVYSPSGAQIASGSGDNTVRLWDARSGALARTLKGHTNSVRSVVYSPSGAQIASGSDDHTVRLWDAESGAPVYTLAGHANCINSAVYSPSGAQIASGSYDYTVRLWDVESGAPVRTLKGHTAYVKSVVYSPSGAQIASGSEDRTVRLWDAENGAPGHTLEGHTHHIDSVVYSPSGAQIASGGLDNTVRLWDAESGTPGHTLEGHTSWVNSVVYSPSGVQIASGSSDHTVRLWEAESGTFMRTLKGHTAYVKSVVYSPIGAQIASGSGDNTVRLWDVESGAPVRTLEGHTDTVNSVVYSPSGTQIASGSRDDTVRLWDVASGQCRAVIDDFDGGVYSVAWKTSIGGTYLVTGSVDKFVRQWQVIEEVDEIQVHVCWISPHAELRVKDTLLEGVEGLSAMNAALLKQRGALLLEKKECRRITQG